MRTLKQSLLCAAAGGLLSLPMAAGAQGDYERPTPPETQPSQPEQTPKQPMEQKTYSGETLDSFVSAYQEVQSVHEEYVEKMNNTDDAAKTNELQTEAQDKIEQTVQDEGLSMSKYRQIVADYRNDPALRERINERMY